MNFLTMDYFVALAEERNFTHAAMRLHITQQTLSAHIAALEKEVGAPLFVRHVPLELTYAGQTFYRYAVDIQKDYRSLRQTLAGVTNQESGEIRIGTAAARERTILPELLAAFQEQYPRIRFLLTEGSNLNLRQRLLDGQIDLAIALFGKSVPGLELYPFIRKRLSSSVLLSFGEKTLRKPAWNRGQKAFPTRRPGVLSCSSAPYSSTGTPTSPARRPAACSPDMACSRISASNPTTWKPCSPCASSARAPCSARTTSSRGSCSRTKRGACAPSPCPTRPTPFPSAANGTGTGGSCWTDSWSSPGRTWKSSNLPFRWRSCSKGPVPARKRFASCVGTGPLGFSFGQRFPFPGFLPAQYTGRQVCGLFISC